MVSACFFGVRPNLIFGRALPITTIITRNPSALVLNEAILFSLVRKKKCGRQLATRLTE
jgi:hypothetical protein